MKVWTMTIKKIITVCTTILIGVYKMLTKNGRNSLKDNLRSTISKSLKRFSTKSRVEVELLTLKTLINWITEKGGGAKDTEFAFITKEKGKGNTYIVTAGVFDEDTERVTNIIQYVAKNIDEDLIENDDLVIYK